MSDALVVIQLVRPDRVRLAASHIAHRHVAQKARASEEAPRLALESARGVSGIMASASSELKRRMLLCTATFITYDTPTPSKHRGSSLDALFTHVETACSVIPSAG